MSKKGSEKGDPNFLVSDLPKLSVGDERPLASGEIQRWDGKDWKTVKRAPALSPVPKKIHYHHNKRG